MYSWMVYLHVLATMTFLFTHGASSIVAWRLRGRPDPATARAWLGVYATGRYFTLLYSSLIVLLISGVAAGFMGDWWGEGWIWLSLALLVAIMVGMYVLGSAYYTKLRRALGLEYFDGRKPHPAEEPAPAEEIERLLARSPALALTVIGFGGIAVILWLMILKPF